MLRFPERLGVKIQNVNNESSLMRMMEKLFTTSNFPCIIMEKEENLSSILKPRRAAKNQSWATGWKTGLPITWAE